MTLAVIDFQQGVNTPSLHGIDTSSTAVFVRAFSNIHPLSVT